MRLTDLQCRTAKYVEGANNKLADGKGLYLHLMSSGSKIWRQKYRFDGKECVLTHGPYPLVSLAEARDKRDEAKKMLLADLNPMAVKRDRKRERAEQKKITFELIARKWHENRKNRWTPDYAQDVLHRLETDIFPEIGSLPIAEINRRDFLDALRKIEQRGAFEMTRRALQYCGQICRFAMIDVDLQQDPTIGVRDALQPFRKGHFAALEPDDLPDFLFVLERNDARLFPQTRNAIRLMMLTFVRTGELIKARWEEINFERREWIIPADRMKMRRPHIVPLSKQALAILEEQKKLSGHREWVFPNQAHPRRHMSNNTILKALENLGYKGRMTGHGFRALAMTTIKERLHYRHEVVDRQLAHAPATKNDQAYDRTKFLDERCKMMRDWADYLDKVTNAGKIIALEQPKAA
jgi:integrase